MSRIDLHVHTTGSDGTFTPREAVALGVERGLKAMAITDHDTVVGHAEAIAAAQELGMELVPGIEISTKYGGAVHVLGYYIDAASESLRPVLDWIVEDRDRRNSKMVELMRADGFDVTYEGMKQRFGEVIGRPHFAELFVEYGLAKDVNDGFARFVEKGQKYYVPRTIMPIDQAVEIIVSAGGVPVLAHPFQYRKNDEELRDLITHCMDHGLRGIECRYTRYDADQVRYLEGLADEYGLIKTGGSDFHGQNKPHNHLGTGWDGELNVPYEWLEKLKEEAKKTR
ncbi:MAG: PHP domain-containing protein [Oscillospiraceae bacterium]|nr:PHP domain-containing protein [Oscillospiraceae bacterium]